MSCDSYLYTIGSIIAMQKPKVCTVHSQKHTLLHSGIVSITLARQSTSGSCMAGPGRGMAFAEPQARWRSLGGRIQPLWGLKSSPLALKVYYRPGAAIVLPVGIRVPTRTSCKGIHKGFPPNKSPNLLYSYWLALSSCLLCSATILG